MPLLSLTQLERLEVLKAKVSREIYSEVLEIIEEVQKDDSQWRRAAAARRLRPHSLPPEGREGGDA
jgi:hypothetical protein